MSFGESFFEEKVSMPIANITKPDQYLCYAIPVDKLRKGSIVGYKIHSKKGVAHHVSVAVCEDYSSKEEFWNCREQQGGICLNKIVSLGGKDGFQEEYAEMDLPGDIGVELGEEFGMKYVLLQAHYKNPSNAEDLLQPTVNLTLKMTEERKPFRMQKMELVSLGYIPAKSVFSSEVALKWTGQRIQAVSYNVHTHNYGIFVEGYLIKNGTVSLIGKKKTEGHSNPHYEVDGTLIIERGDIIAARCVYQNNETFPVQFGMRNRDEMCNFGVNFKYRRDDSLTYPMAILQCQNAQNSTWCENVVPGVNALCERSKTFNFGM